MAEERKRRHFLSMESKNKEKGTEQIIQAQDEKEGKESTEKKIKTTGNRKLQETEINSEKSFRIRTLLWIPSSEILIGFLCLNSALESLV